MEHIWTSNVEDEGKVQTTNSNGGENHSGKKIRFLYRSVGSSPTIGTIFHANVTQLVECLPSKQIAEGSSPFIRSI